MDKDQRVHERRESAGKHEDEHRGDDGELQFAPLEMIELLAIDGCHFPYPPGCPRHWQRTRSESGVSWEWWRELRRGAIALRYRGSGSDNGKWHGKVALRKDRSG